MLVSKEFKFSYAHLLPNHAGKCRNLHGHNARMIVTVSGPTGRQDSSEGMVVDFSRLKDIVETAVIQHWDHKFLAMGDEWVCLAAEFPEGWAEKSDNRQSISEQITYLSIRTTAENLARLAFIKIRSALAAVGDLLEVELDSVQFYETDSASATYTHKMYSEEYED